MDKFFRVLIVDDDDTVKPTYGRPMRSITIVNHQNTTITLKIDFEQVVNEVTMWRRLEVNEQEKDENLKFQLILLDLVLDESEPDKLTGLEIMPKLRNKYPNLPVIVATNTHDWDTGNTAFMLGAKFFLPKNKFKPEIWANYFYHAITNAQNEQQVNTLQKENEVLKGKITYRQHPDYPIIGTSIKIEQVRKTLHALTDEPDTHILLLGETGVGKNIAARFYHHNCDHRMDAPFEEIHFSNIGKDLIEAELFGAKKGSYTGATEDRIGRLQNANGGVVLLDEIGDLTLESQGKLLQFLNDKVIRPVGSKKDIKVDVGIIAATNKDIDELVEEGGFRQDLRARLDGYSMIIPPLRERRDDIEPLLMHFLKVEKGSELKNMMEKSVILTLIDDYHWPENIRELSKVVQKMQTNRRMLDLPKITLACLEGVLKPAKKPLVPLAASPSHSVSLYNGKNHMSPEMEGLTHKQQLLWIELQNIEAALNKTNGRKEEAAQLLSLGNADNIYTRIRKVKIKHPDWIQHFTFIRKYYS
jgi:DNA-binding NtrC family response regulator